MKLRLAALVLALPALAACSMTTASADRPAPAGQAAAVDADTAKVDSLLARMSLEHKIAQLIMPDISAVTPADMRRYRFGSILNGGNSGPGGNDKAPAPEWLALADAFWEASTAPLPGGEPAIPMLWGTDAVHGHGNIPGATIFPHNIGLGAAGDADLVRRIGEITAAEVAVTGIDWAFSPTIAVATDTRWGRSYESFSEDTALVSRLGEAMVLGLQGQPGQPGFLDQRRVLATAKHFFGDGGTGGKDRGDTKGTAEAIRRQHAAPYLPAIAAQTQTIMASFSSINGEKMHGNRALLTDYLRGTLGFDGLVVGDWNGHGELPGCSNSDCPEALMAGLDIYMVPEDWRGLHASLLAQTQSGRIPMARIDAAVRRVLLVKQRYGLFDKPRPSARTFAGRWDMLGSAGHRAIARDAVRKSLVLLKNDGVLPIRANARVLVTGPGADSIAIQSGGWSITWQGGGDLANGDFPGATSIYAGLAQALQAQGGKAELSADGSYVNRPDVAVVVFGEPPYAEFVGDRDDLAFRDEAGLALLRRYRAEAIPAVAVFLSGRPMWVSREIEASGAFVAAWLPGSEGAGLADVLVGRADGKPTHDFSGRLSFGWPAGCGPRSAIAYPFGFGGSYASPPASATLAKDCPQLDGSAAGGLKIFGPALQPSIRAMAADGGGQAVLPNLLGASPSSAMTIRAFDLAAQEDARRITWAAPARISLNWPASAAPLPTGELVLRYQLARAPQGKVALTPLCSDCAPRPVDLAASLTLGAGKGWRNLRVPLACLGAPGLSGLELEAQAPLELEIASAAIAPQATQNDCSGPF